MEKNALFELLGFSKDDSLMIKDEFEKQAQQNYINSKYSLGKLNEFGQRINIDIEITKDGRTPVKFITGWLVKKNGVISCNTPVGDR